METRGGLLEMGLPEEVMDMAGQPEVAVEPTRMVQALLVVMVYIFQSGHQELVLGFLGTTLAAAEEAVESGKHAVVTVELVVEAMALVDLVATKILGKTLLLAVLQVLVLVAVLVFMVKMLLLGLELMEDLGLLLLDTVSINHRPYYVKI